MQKPGVTLQAALGYGSTMSSLVDGGNLPVAGRSFQKAKTLTSGRRPKAATGSSYLKAPRCTTVKDLGIQNTNQTDHFKDKQLTVWCQVQPRSASWPAGRLENQVTFMGFVLDPGVQHLEQIKLSAFQNAGKGSATCHRYLLDLLVLWELLKNLEGFVKQEIDV